MGVDQLQPFDGDVQLPLLDLVVLVKLLEGGTLLLPRSGIQPHEADQFIAGHVEVTDTGEQKVITCTFKSNISKLL